MATLITLPQVVLQEFLVCQLCEESFDTPKILPCQHTFCQTCLERHLRRSTTTTASLWFLCPQCRNITDVPDNGIAEFRTNDFIFNLKNIVEVNSKDNKCAKNSEFVREMKDSGNLPNRNSSSRNLPYGNESLNRCEVNRQHSRGTQLLCSCQAGEVRFFCEQCDNMLCRDCASSGHKTHNLLILEDKADKERDNFMTLIHNARREIIELDKSIFDLDNYNKQLRRSRDDATTTLKKHITMLRELINKLESDMLADIERAYSEERNRSDTVTKGNNNVVSVVKNLNDFSEKVLGSSSDSEIIAWRPHVEKQLNSLLLQGRKVDAAKLRTNPVLIRFNPKNNVTEKIVKHLIGEIQHGRNVNIVELQRYKPGGARSKVLADTDALLTSLTLNKEPAMTPEEQIIKSRIHPGKLLKSFSVFTQGSNLSPILSGLAMLPNGDTITVDRSNACVKFFNTEGGMYKKIHGSDSLWDVVVLQENYVALTDRTVHIFDSRGKVHKVLRQQPRDSHGIAINGHGDVVVTDCTSRCVYVLSMIGGTIRRLITQFGRRTFKKPHYVAVNENGDIVISDSESNCVVIIGDKGQIIGQYGGQEPETLNTPCGVCVDKLGNIAVCDMGNNRVILLDPCGQYLCTIVQGKDNIDRPNVVTVDHQGNLVVGEEQGRVRVFQYREAM